MKKQRQAQHQRQQGQKPRIFYLVSSELGAGLTSVSLGMVRALDREGIRVAFYKPLHQPPPPEQTNTAVQSSGGGNHHHYGEPKDRSTHFLRATGNFDPPEPLAVHYAEDALKSSEGLNQLLELVVEQYEDAITGSNATVVVVEGLSATRPGMEMLNKSIASTLDAQVVLVTSLHNEWDSPPPQDSNENQVPNQAYDTKEATVTGDAASDCSSSGSSHDTSSRKLQDMVDRAINVYGKRRIVGCIANKMSAPSSSSRSVSRTNSHIFKISSCSSLLSHESINNNNHEVISGVPLLGTIDWNPKLLNVRTPDMAHHLGATVLFKGDMDRRRIGDVCLVARNVSHMVERLRRDTLIITPYDREDILLAACMAELNGVPLAGVVLTGVGTTMDGDGPAESVLGLCDKALKETGLPLMLFDNDSYVAATTASAIDQEVPMDDIQRIEKVMDKIASRLDVDAFIQGLETSDSNLALAPPRLSPPAFMHQLVTRARHANRRIVLPEGTDPRVLQAAVKCQGRGIAQCILLGDPQEIHRLAWAQGLTKFPPRGLEIVNPTVELREKYVEPMVQLRKHKGLTNLMARAQLEDITVLATMMLALGEVDGLVSGAVHTSANTVRPALQLIKARPEAAIVSSVFFMLLPDQVVLYGDCAINPDPNPTQLASIAIESAESAKAFGIDPRVAMLSYSTGTSGKGSDVEKVRKATELVHELRPDLLVDGPLQYDAASTMDVAQSKAPGSRVAGKATVLVFPDLNTGNTTYKAVQRTANVICVGPMLQGLQRPVNDLSRGALVEDIVYTIALTSIQAEQTEETLGTTQQYQPQQ